jgi:hypothetical protein
LINPFLFPEGGYHVKKVPSDIMVERLFCFAYGLFFWRVRGGKKRAHKQPA